jgi:hypothetical protein
MSEEENSGLGSIFGPLFGSNASAQASEQYIKAMQKEQQHLQGDELYRRVSDWLHSVREID